MGSIVQLLHTCLFQAQHTLTRTFLATLMCYRRIRQLRARYAWLASADPASKRFVSSTSEVSHLRDKQVKSKLIDKEFQLYSVREGFERVKVPVGNDVE